MLRTTFEDHISNLRNVLRRLQQKGVKLKPRKCRLFQKEVSYLGWIVSADGHRVDPSGTKAVTDLRDASPKTVREVRKMVGLLGYYRRDIQDFSRIAPPLNKLLKGPEAEAEKGQEDRRTRKRKALTQLPPSYPVQWEERHQEALNKLVDCITQLPVMAYPRYDQPFTLHTDASEHGLSAVLYQEQEGKLRVMRYGSRTLTPVENNYRLHSGKLEFLALKWAITEKFHDYLN